jgi:hypothetical protein
MKKIKQPKKTFELIIPGPLKGYLGNRQKFWDKRNQEYSKWKKMVRLLGNERGFPEDIPNDKCAKIFVEIFWKKRARIDGKNVLGAIEDALFKRDRRILMGTYHAIEHMEKEVAYVQFYFYDVEEEGDRWNRNSD